MDNLWAESEDVHPAFKDFAANFARHCGASKEVFLGQLSVAVKSYGESVARDARAEERERCAGIAENSGMASGEEIAKRIRAGEAEKGAG